MAAPRRFYSAWCTARLLSFSARSGLILLFAAGLLAGCAADGSRNRTAALSTPKDGTNSFVALAAESGSTLRIGDFITVSFTDVPQIVAAQFRDQKVRIPDDGMITLPYNVRVQAAGRRISDLEASIRTNYVPGYFQNLTAIVKPEERYYYVGGEVRVPGPRPYIGNMTVLRAIDTAQGFTDFARRTHIEVRHESGKTDYVDWKKARKDPRLDLPVFPNDHIIVPKGI
jgi:protein involved in polysaccharide export with SLBB domain